MGVARQGRRTTWIARIENWVKLPADAVVADVVQAKRVAEFVRGGVPDIGRHAIVIWPACWAWRRVDERQMETLTETVSARVSRHFAVHLDIGVVDAAAALVVRRRRQGDGICIVVPAVVDAAAVTCPQSTGVIGWNDSGRQAALLTENDDVLIGARVAGVVSDRLVVRLRPLGDRQASAVIHDALPGLPGPGDCVENAGACRIGRRITPRVLTEGDCGFARPPQTVLIRLWRAQIRARAKVWIG